MENSAILEQFNEIAIVFSSKFKKEINGVYDELSARYPNKEIYLVHSNDILCSAKHSQYESHVLLGVECPIHKFKNAVYFKLDLSRDTLNKIKNYNGKIAIDQLYKIDSEINKEKILDPEMDMDPDTPILVVTESQLVLDYYSQKYERVDQMNDSLESITGMLRGRVRYLMKENTNANKLKDKKMIGVVFTSRIFEQIATSIVDRINHFSRAYKIFLKDVNYERLISIDNLDCIVLVDCPLFQCDFRMHIPIISSFSVECFLSDQQSDQSAGDHSNDCLTEELAITGHAGEIMEARWFKGVQFQTEEEDMTVHQGRMGVPMGYEKEGELDDSVS